MYFNWVDGYFRMERVGEKFTMKTFLILQKRILGKKKRNPNTPRGTLILINIQYAFQFSINEWTILEELIN
jgi:hypothetical protein